MVLMFASYQEYTRFARPWQSNYLPLAIGHELALV